MLLLCLPLYYFTTYHQNLQWRYNSILQKKGDVTNPYVFYYIYMHYSTIIFILESNFPSHTHYSISETNNSKYVITSAFLVNKDNQGPKRTNSLKSASQDLTQFNVKM